MPTTASAWARIFLHGLKNTLVGGIVLIVLLLPVGAFYQWLGQTLEARRFPQQGHGVALGPSFPGLSLNLNCTGEGGPTVVLESGSGIPAIGWNLVQPRIAQFARVCSYDRAGYGWSTMGPLPRTSLRIARELHALLAASGEKGPYVFVGHSFGGFNIRVYNHLYPQDVAGMVLVDASQEDLTESIRPRRAPSPWFSLYQRMRVALAPQLVRFGFSRFFDAMGSRPPDTPEDIFDQTRYLALQPKFASTLASEALEFQTTPSVVRASGGLGNKPLIVLTAGKQGSNSIFGDAPEQYQKIWVNDLQVRLTRLSTRGKQIVVADSGHMIPFERPGSIADAVRQVQADLHAPFSSHVSGSKEVRD